MSKNFPAPKDVPEFIEYWEKFLPKVTERDNFHESHLEQLSILCDLYIEYNKLSRFIEENGYSYGTSGRYGENTREFPEVKIQQKIISEIRQYSKILGLILAKDTGKNDDNGGEWK